ncbi:hypothetical protein HOD75_01515 [archaeon]|jgi:hypothetical protein|nr:hypothetical protein [archaeon]MBT4241556.1 hypothetical protein [archaeon]MBT4417572.1 hypothetical protein [archaeon]
MQEKNNNLTQEILKKVKQHKKYKSIADEIVVEEINKYLKSNPSEKINKEMIKSIRKQLHRLYSSYQTGKKTKREKYLEELKTNKNNQELLNNLLSITISTKERLNQYPELYKQIFKITGKPKTIVDLGSGLNPLSYPLMKIKTLNYYAYDIDEEDMKFLNKYFKIMKQQGLNGKAEIINLRKLENNSKLKNLPESDIILLLKVIDLIDEKKKNISEELIKQLIKKTKYIVASFATKTLTRKPMKLPRRQGFEKMLERNNLKAQTIKTDNEIFYMISESL